MDKLRIVVLGGSHALGVADDASDWDVGLYYRGEIDLAALREPGTVYPLALGGAS